MDGELPRTVGHEAAALVDELGEGLTDVAVGDRVFGLSVERSSARAQAALGKTAELAESGRSSLPVA